MRATRSRLVFVTFAVAAMALACHPSEPLESDPSSVATEAQGAGDSQTSEEVTYEPAYPDAVSTEGLSATDVEQQEASHAHGASQQHLHGAGSHSHDPADGEGDRHEHPAQDP